MFATLAYNNEMDFSLWQVQWEEVVCDCNKFNKVQALMIGHQSNETIYTALCTIADGEDFGNQDEDVQFGETMTKGPIIYLHTKGGIEGNIVFD